MAIDQSRFCQLVAAPRAPACPVIIQMPDIFETKALIS
jgi:hypothetical protein